MTDMNWRLKSVFMFAGLVFIVAFTLMTGCDSVQFRRSSAVAPAFEQMAYGQGYLDGYAEAEKECKAKRAIKTRQQIQKASQRAAEATDKALAAEIADLTAPPGCSKTASDCTKGDK